MFSPNDWDADGDAFDFVGNSQPTSGAATWSSVDHMIIYVPNPGFSGIDQFTYSVADSTVPEPVLSR